jgi:hypothetical protein
MKINPFAAMGNSPMAMLMRAAQSGGNPMQIIGQMAGNNPQMRQGMQMIQGKTPAELEQYARNMASAQGADVNQILSSLGIEL